MRVTMNFGQTGLPLELPDDWEVTVITKPSMPILPDPGAAIVQALSQPVVGPPLARAAAGCRTACILICDITRPVPNGQILPPLLDTLTTAGIPATGITVLVATGLHRPNEGRELEELLGDPRVLATVRVVNHFARRDEDHLDLGSTRRGTPIKLDRRFIEADLKIVTGLVEPHFMAGYSGGRKVIVPGIAHQETITRIHTTEFLEDDRACNCVLEGNPLHAEQMEIMGHLGPVYAVNTVLDDQRRLSHVNFGPLVASHLAAVEFTRRYAEVPETRYFRTVVTSAAGYPLDATYYQTVKGLVGALEIMEPGGRLFIVSACSLGLGSPEYAAAQARLVHLGPEGFLADLRPKKAAAVDEWQTEMQLRAMRRGSIVLFAPGLNPEERGLTGVTTVDDPAAAIRDWVTGCEDRRVAIIPEGPYVVPRQVPAGG